MGQAICQLTRKRFRFDWSLITVLLFVGLSWAGIIFYIYSLR